MSSETLDSQIAESLVKSMSTWAQEQMQVSQDTPEKKSVPMLTGRQIAFMMLALVQDQRHSEVRNWHERLELFNDNLNKFDDAAVPCSIFQ